MTPIQQLMLGVGAKKKTYLDDVFSTYVYTGTGSAHTINNGIDLAGEGGLVWAKARNQSWSHLLMDTVRGGGKVLFSNTNDAEVTRTDLITAFNSNGYTAGSDGTYGSLNHSAGNNSSWTFRKAPGFFDVVTYTGTGSARTVAHSLGSIPAMIWVKRTDTTEPWRCWHRGIGNDHAIRISSPDTSFSSSTSWNSTDPTSTHFTVNHNGNNANGGEFIAYVFAGGESNASEARSVDFDGSGDYLTSTHGSAGSSDFSMGTGDFTIECWVKKDATAHQGFYQISPTTDGYTSSNFGNTIGAAYDGTGWTMVSGGSQGNDSAPEPVTVGAWYHIAHVRYNGVTKLYVNGTEKISITDTYNYDGYTVAIGIYYSTGFYLDGNISNFRIVKGTAVYTSSFKPPTEPLTNITNTKLLCCNNSSTTGSTVTPGTITANGDPTASTDSPFDDPAGFVFGDAGDQNVIKCGSYVGTGSAGLEVNLGWEPQWLMIKNADGANTDWYMIDMMRGAFALGDDDDTAQIIKGNASAAEFGTSAAHPTSTGFRLTSGYSHVNQNTHTYVYVAIRRPDGYVQKPRTATELFAMDTGSNSSTIPNFDSGFPVDFALMRRPGIDENWYTGARLTGGKYLKTNTTATENNGTESDWVFDSNTGWCKSYNSNHQSWMWKRHAGFDVVAFQGTNQNNLKVRHSLNAVPEMIWLKNREASEYWPVYHKGLNGGTNPEQYFLRLNGSNAETDYNEIWNDTAPTAIDFTVGIQGASNGADKAMLAILFASVDGISKVGSYTGTSSSPSVTITTGFSPRLLIIKRADGLRSWNVFDTLRGIGTGGTDDKRLVLDTSAAQGDGSYVNVTSTGFTVQSTLDVGTDGGKYIYYAHA